MLGPLLFALTLGSAPAIVAWADPASAPLRADEVFDRRLEAAGDDVAALWEVGAWCEDTNREREATKVWKKIVRLSPGHRRARQKLGHVEHEGEWFEDENALERHLTQVREQRARDRGWVKYKGEYVPPEDLTYLKRGLVRGPLGRWLTREESKRLERGWTRQDLVWVAPDELDRLEAGLWKCDDDWLPLEEADRFHSRLDQPWVIPTDRVTLWTNQRREVTEEILLQVDRAWRDMERAFGCEPAAPLNLFIARRAEMAQAFVENSAGSPREGRGLIGPLGGTFAEAWFDEDAKRWLGGGVSAWDDSTEDSQKFAVHDVRLALGLAFADALDPSREAVETLERRGLRESFTPDFWAEKRHPEWWRWGTASYASRYFPDRVGRGGDPYWARKWSVQNLARSGGLPFLRAIFEMQPQGQDRGSPRLVNAAGLVVAFILDGDCGPVREAHRDLKEVLARGGETGKIFERLRKALEDHEDELIAFAGQ